MTGPVAAVVALALSLGACLPEHDPAALPARRPGGTPTL